MSTAERSTTAEERQSEKDGQFLHMHTAHPAVPVPYFTPGDLKANAQSMTSRVPVRDVIFYGGLGALTVAGALEWPVALAVGGAAMVLRGRAKGEAKEEAKGRRKEEAKAEQQEEARGEAKEEAKGRRKATQYKT
ncbi:hypothetical protein [Streptomyces sporangiiformans]|uniref:hypothetical protein n=1 Tax=Streptomyces sporangiiformans TaxID=2315329 RepID=UPI0013C43DD9|nr:hypothetical protein [Streptomyces sporangiiformans]